MPKETPAPQTLRRWTRRSYVRLALLPLLLAGLGLASMVLSIVLVTRPGEPPALGLVSVTTLLALGAGLAALLGWRARLEAGALVDGLSQLEDLAGGIGAGRYYQPIPQLPIAELQQTAERVAAMGRQLGDGHQALLEAQRDLAASEARYRAAVDGIHEVIFQTDPEGHWTFLNAAWEQLSGYPAADSLGRPFWDFLHPRDRPGMQASFRTLTQGLGGRCRQEVRCLRRDGGCRWVLVHAQAAAGGPGIAGTLIDVHGRRRAEDRLRLSAAAVERSAQGVLIADARMRVCAVNPAFTRITGYEADDIRGRHPGPLLAPDPDRAAADPWHAPPGRDGWRGELYQRRKSGEEQRIWLDISAVHDREGTVSGYVALFTAPAPGLYPIVDLPARHRQDPASRLRSGG